MLAVIAEFKIRKGAEAKFEQALGEMQAHVKSFDGYLGEEPCQSLADGKKLVTIFYWRDRESMAAWRNDAEHRRIQELAREKIFSWYRIYVAEVERSYDWSVSEEGEPT